MFKQIVAQVAAQDDPTLGLVKDGNVFYFVINNPEAQNTFDDVWIDKAKGFLDTVA